MKRSKQKATQPKKQTGGPSTMRPEKARAIAAQQTRARMRNWLIIVALVGALAALAWWGFNASRMERDLSVIGNGKPAVVQIHDVTCGSCEALQTNAKRALSRFDSRDYEYVVADVRTSEGLRYANSLGLGITTLLITDPQGEPVQAYPGERSVDQLVDIFTRQFAPFGVVPKG